MLGTLTMAGLKETARPVAPDFADLYERYSDMVFKTALRVTGNRDDAEDVLQTVFMRILRREDALDPMKAPEGYLRRSAANAAVDVVRRRQVWKQDSISETPDRLHQQSSEELKQRLRQAISTLEGRDAEMFVLRYIDGLSNGELAELYGLEKTSVAVRLHRIRQGLQEEILK